MSRKGLTYEEIKSSRHKIIPASYLILIENGKLLMLRRYNTGYHDGDYSLVAGHLEEGETFTQTMIREAKEEAGVELSSHFLEVVHVMNRKEHVTELEKRERIDVFIRANRWQGEVQNKELNRCDELDWFPLDNLPENIIPYIRQAIGDICDGIFYSEFGFDES